MTTHRFLSTRARAMVLAAAVVALTCTALVVQLLGGPPDYAETLLPLAFAALGLIMARHAPANVLGWLFLVVGLMMSCGQAGDSLMYLARDELDLIGLAKVAAVATGWLWFPTLSLMATFCLLLFPDGRLPSPRWRPVARLAGAGIVLSSVALFAFAFVELDTLIRDPNADAAGPPYMELILAAAMSLVGIAVLASITSLFVRWRSASGAPRQQLKWFALGGVVQLLGIGANFFDSSVALFVSELTTLALPVAATIAITRYRLYDIDRILSRTLTYTALTGLLLGLYLVGVTFITAVTAPVTGDAPIAVAAATLLAAAAFGPARRRIQSTVDRRFNRARYDAVRTAEAYRAKLRDQLDLDSIGGDLVATARLALEPAAAMLWLRDASGAPR